MAEFKTNILSEDDRTYLAEFGMPLAKRPDLYEVTSDEKVVISIKGMQYIKEVCKTWGVNVALAELTDEKRFLEFRYEVSSRVMQKSCKQMSARLDAGVIPAKDREIHQELISGSLGSILTAFDKAEACALAGDNVVPVSFGRRK